MSRSGLPGQPGGLLLSLLLGACWPLAFAPFGWSYLAMVLLAALFFLVQDSSPRVAAQRGYVFGFAAFAAGTYWIAITLHQFANMDWFLAGALVAFLAAYCALYPALALWLAARFFRGGARLLALPVLWVLGEWLRARLLTGFPWLATGYSQTGALLGGFAPWLGQYGVGLATAAVAAILAALAVRRSPLAMTAGGAALAALYGAALAAATVSFTHPSGAPLQVRLLQGNVPISEKWDAPKLDAILLRYATLIAATPPGTQLVVLPETAFPVFQTEIPQFIDNLRRWSAAHHSTLIIGMPEVAGRDYYNAALEIDSLAPLRWYRKQHLVPFGEYIPLPWLLASLVHNFMPGLGSFTVGRGASVLPVGGEQAGMSICYEESFSRDVRKGVVQGANFLVNISDYAWYGHSIAAAQSLQMAAMQAREEQKPDVRATNTGITALITPAGRVAVQLPQFVEGALDGKIQPMAGQTPFGRWGEWPFLAMALLLLALAYLPAIKRRR
ncbi:apolipoprotein N-acyltransferase [Acidithiobacillus sulfuriphilus]|uniref:Apolipoprotein N-acyltransferase n=3 Tax=Acidithiobacillus sulfuriphilus TaxID=1867749 RepID=A0ACD5HQA2_9PROT